MGAFTAGQPLAGKTVAFAIPSANMGLAYRYRAQIIPLFLSFAAAGFIQRRAPCGPAASAGAGSAP